jgi:hypothetical protein
MGNTFGHFDKNATTTNDQGQSMHDAYGGLSDSQQRNRRIVGGIGAGLGGMSTMNQPQQSGGAPPIVPAQQPQVDMSAAMPQYFQNPMQRRSPSQQFFGGY